MGPMGFNLVLTNSAITQLLLDKLDRGRLHLQLPDSNAIKQILGGRIANVFLHPVGIRFHMSLPFMILRSQRYCIPSGGFFTGSGTNPHRLASDMLQDFRAYPMLAQPRSL